MKSKLPFVILCAALLGANPASAGELDDRLVLAVRRIRIESLASTVADLLKQGADVNYVEADGITPLMFSMHYGYANIEIVRLLLNAGAKPNARDQYGHTALMMASGGQAGNDRADVVRVLLEKGADPKAKDTSGNTPLTEAIRRGYLKTVQALLNKGADPNDQAPDDTPLTPLMLACEGGYIGIVRALLDHGADPNTSVNLGRDHNSEVDEYANALDFSKGHPKIERLLIAKGAKALQK